jgi:F420H(2)-dependent quinone reductase
MHDLGVSLLRWIMAALSASQMALRGFIRVMSWLHLAIYRGTRGRLTRTLGLPNSQMILLTTTGRKSGRLRTVPLLSIRRGDEWLVIASHGGLERSPGWYFNLRSNPEATVQAGDHRDRVVAEIADESARAVLWPLFVKEFPGYVDYQRRTSREISIFLLHISPSD